MLNYEENLKESTDCWRHGRELYFHL